MHRTVHLIVPPCLSRVPRAVYRRVLPRGVLQLARAAKDDGWDATVVDAYSAPEVLEPYLAVLQRGLPSLVGIAIHGPPAIEPALAISARIRELDPSLPLLFGGQLANVDPQLLLSLLPYRSLLFAGDADAIAGDILAQALKVTGGPELMQQREIVPWKCLPSPELLLHGPSYYLSGGDFEYHLETQLGCPYRCFHCGTGRKGLYARTVNRPLESIASELDLVVAWVGELLPSPPQLWITDETFASDPGHAVAFCDLLSARPEQWGWRAQSRPDVISSDLLARMAEAGCYRLAFGVEIPTDAGLELLGKREVMATVQAAFALCRDHGISPEAIVVVGSPEDPTRPEEFLAGLDALGAESVQAYLYHPIPGSPWWRKYGTAFMNGSRPRVRWSDLDFHSPPVNLCGEDAERAVVAFLALYVWQPEGTREALPLPPASIWRSQCTDCGFEGPVEKIFEHRPTSVCIRRCTTERRKYYLATAPGRACVLKLDPAEHRNLYAGLVPVDRWDEASRVCPCCLSKGNGCEARTGEPGATRFLAI